MVCGSVSILSSTSSFPATSNTTLSDSSLPTTSTTRVKFFNASKRIPDFSLKIRASSSLNQSIEDDGAAAADQFLGNSSIADFMRFKRESRESNGELQTAVVSYRKKFPWSVLQPFLQVDLVSTIHIADKEMKSKKQIK